MSSDILLHHTFTAGGLSHVCAQEEQPFLHFSPNTSNGDKQSHPRATKADSEEQHMPHLAAEPSIPRIFAFHHKAKKLKRMKGLINEINLFLVSLGSTYRKTAFLFTTEDNVEKPAENQISSLVYI